MFNRKSIYALNKKDPNAIVYANVSQLVCLSNLENLNAVFINEGISQSDRLAKLNAIAISQMKVLTEDHRLLQLEAADDTEKPQ